MGHRHKSFIIAALVALLLVACSSGETEAEGSDAPMDSTSIQLSWIHTIEFSGFYLAEEEGHYVEENLDVEVLAGGFDDDGNYIDPVSQVLEGKADFGVNEAAVVLQARAEGAPLVAVAALFQRHPLALVSLAEKNIVRPEDLVGQRVQASASGSDILLKALLAAQEIDPAQVDISERLDPSIAPLLNDEADVIDGWVINEIVTLSAEGYEYNTILASDYGIDMYPNVIFTTEDMIANRPDVVERFVLATLRGIRSAVEDPERATDLTLERNPERDPEFELESMRRAVPLFTPTGSQPGTMTDKMWLRTYDILLDQGIVQPMNVKDAYTLAFLEKIYGE
jgi:NitT/TauT family transport system substrate-binding protein